ncbi:MAG: hypothetical protein IIB44_01140 [Candidatus Marinimicrobia bacterium]|nr:hypothetical protein [Candidatus Neomarinimicrobiota bacterium]
MEILDMVQPFASSDQDSKRIWWWDGGVHQNITFSVHTDPISGMHCWHQKVRLTFPDSDEKYGDIFADTNKAHKFYKKWMAMTRPGPGPNGLRRPLWMARTLRPDDSAYYNLIRASYSNRTASLTDVLWAGQAHTIDISVLLSKAVIFSPDNVSELVDLPDYAVQAGTFWFVLRL